MGPAANFLVNLLYVRIFSHYYYKVMDDINVESVARNDIWFDEKERR